MENPVPQELRTAALAAFSPLVISVTSSTPDNVMIPSLIQHLTASLPHNLFVLDGTEAARDTHPKSAAKKPRAAARTDGSGGSVVDLSRTVSQRLRELYVQTAVSLEKGRRDAVAARDAALQSLKQQYVEEGMSDAEALATATAELADDDDASSDEADDDEPLAPRHAYPFIADGPSSAATPLVVCLANHPTRLEDIEELSAAEVSLHVLLDVQCPVPFGATRRASVAVAPSEKRTTAAARGSHSKPSPVSDGGASESLADALRRHQQERAGRPPTSSDALSRVLVHRLDVPCEVRPGDAQGGLRATLSEKALAQKVTATLWDLEAKLRSYRAWSASSCPVSVPRYTPLTNPDAVPDLSELEAEETAKRGKPANTKKTASNSISGDEGEAVASAPLTTPAHPADMSQVAANRTQYDTYVTAHDNGAQPAVTRFAQACIHQAAHDSDGGASGGAKATLTKAQCDALRIASDKRAAAQLVRDTWRAIATARQDVDGEGVAHGKQLWTHGPRLSDALRACSQTATAERQSEASLDACLHRLLTEFRGLKEGPPADTEALIRDLLQCGVATFSDEADLGALTQLLAAKNIHGWRTARGQLGEAVVYALVRGLSATRTQHSTYRFTGETTFPEYARLLDDWYREHLVFFPPPPPSDADDAPDEEEDDEDEDESELDDEASLIEDEDGNLVPRPRRPRRVPTPPPPEDHVQRVASALRRRRVLEELAAFLHTPPRQSLLSHGEGALLACEEVEWVCVPDSLIEVERSVCNTRAVTATVTTVYDAEFGFLIDDAKCEVGSGAALGSAVRADGPTATLSATPSGVPPPHVRCGVRTFVHLGDVVRLQTEVLADNTAAAEAAAYALAVENAKKQAKQQFEAAAAKLKTLKGKEKQSVQVQTLEEVEKEHLSHIAAPVPCRKELPELHISVRLEQAVLQFDEARAAICATPSQHRPPSASVSSPAESTFAVLAPDLSNTNKAQVVTLRALRTVTYFAKGVVELRYASTPGLAVALHPDGSYVTCWVGADKTQPASCVTVSAQGQCTVRRTGDVHSLPSLPCAPVLAHGGDPTGYVRSDGLRVDKGVAGAGARIAFADGLRATQCADGAYQWEVDRLPPVLCHASAGTLTVELASTSSPSSSLGCTLCFDVPAATLTVKSLAHGTVTASVDLVDYRVRVRTASPGSGSPSSCSNVVEIDAAFGGLVCGQVSGTLPAVSPSSVLCRVSPLGTCTVERAADGTVCVPAGYTTHEAPLPVYRVETASPVFVHALQSTDLRFPRDALHYRRPTLADLDEAAPRLPTAKAKTQIDAAVRDLYVPCLQNALHIPTPPRQHQENSWPLPPHTVTESLEACCVVVGPGGDKLTFLSAPCRRVLLERWIDRLCPLSLPPVPVPATCGLVERTTHSAVAVYAKSNAAANTLRWRLLIDSDGQSLSRWTSSYVRKLISAPTALKARVLDACTTTLRARTAYSAEEDEPLKRETPAGCSAHPPARDSLVGVPDPTALRRDSPRRLNFWDSDLAAHGMARVARTPAPRAAPPTPPTRANGKISPVSATESMETPASGASASHAGVAGASTLYNSRAADSYGGVPLMRSGPATIDSVAARSSKVLGATASSQGHHPSLSVTPSEVIFGTVAAGRAYSTLFYVTNTSTVPCRYRVSPASEHKMCLSLQYPHRFLAAGMTDAVQVTLSGYQPLGELNATLLLTHESGSVPVSVYGVTVEQGTPNSLAAGVVCLGDAQTPFMPGTTSGRTAASPDSQNLSSDDESTSAEDVAMPAS